MTPTRGERNNNPGNIDRTSERWQGMAADQSGDARFVVFTKPEFGIRALAKLLLNYDRKYGIRSVRGIINRWAPPIENNTDAYIKSVSDRIGVGPDDPIHVDDPVVLEQLVVAIIKHENGRCIYDDVVIVRGIEMALEGTT